jgi:sugar phosphate isomerase/epimerase
VIAAQLYTVRDKLKDPSKLVAVLRQVRGIGYRAVEVAGLGPKTIDRFAEALKNSGLVACAAHVSLERLKGDSKMVKWECKSWGCKYVVVPALPEEYRSAAGFKRFAIEARRLNSDLRSSGLELVYHNHAFELQRSGGHTGLDTLFAEATPYELQAELDTYWLQYGGANPAAWIRKLKGRVPIVHLKDMAVDRGNPIMAEIGEGNLDWPDILNACKEAGTEWLVVEQDECWRDPMDSLAISYRNLSKLTGDA